MRPLLRVAGLCLLCVPLLLLCWVMLSIRFAALDALTLRSPDTLRYLIASGVMQRAQQEAHPQPLLDRVLRLDHDNREAWGQRCADFAGQGRPEDDLHTCERAVALDDSAPNLAALGQAQERLGRECDAEASFTRASAKGSNGQDYTYLQSMGRAALRCGDLYGARAGLQAALSVEDRTLHDPTVDHEEIEAATRARQLDSEYLSVVLTRLRQPGPAQQACTQALPAASPHPVPCPCALDPQGLVHC